MCITESQHDLQTVNFKVHTWKLSRLNSGNRTVNCEDGLRTNTSGKLASERVLEQRTQNTKL